MTSIATITNELIVGSKVMKSNNIDLIASQLGYSPMLIINALYQGERDGKLLYDRRHKTFEVAPDVETRTLSLGEDFAVSGDFDIANELWQLTVNINGDEIDMCAEELMTWLGISDMRVKMMAYVDPRLAMYKVTDLKDRKSTYTFITLVENAGKRWGEKQFSTKGKSNDTKSASKRES